MDDQVYKLERQDGAVIMQLVLDSILWDDNEKLKAVFGGLLREGAKNIILDLSKTGYVSSVVLSSFVYMFKTAKDAGGTMILCGANPKVKELLRMTDLDKVLEIAVDKEEALKRLKAGELH